MCHCFVAWILLIGIESLCLIRLMGHGSKQMVYEVYGNYLEGVEADYLYMLNYFGKDFVEVKKTPGLQLNCSTRSLSVFPSYCSQFDDQCF
jgi:hypothetical protein